jgi:hypothetical protein
VRRTQALVGAGPFLVVALTAVAVMTPGHSQGADTISSLATPGRPLRLLAVGALAIYGLLVVAGAAGVRSATAARLVRLHGGATVVTALVPKVGAFTASVPNVVHVVAAVVAGAALVGAMLACGHVRWAALAVLTALTFRLAWGTEVYGAIERLVVLVGVWWVAARSWR